MKKTLILILIISQMVSASNDAFLTVDSKDAGLCLGLDSPDMQTCQNQTLIIDGTADHILYILPESEITNPNNSTLIARYAFFEPITMIVSSFGYVLLLCGLFGAVVYMLARAFGSLTTPGRRRR